jgi:SAM-dependent methyltransferase
VTAPMPEILLGDARALPLPDESVDLVVTSPPYFSLRDYGIDGQIGNEPTPGEFIEALLAVTRECVRVLKPTGSMFVNLGDKYAERTGPERVGGRDDDEYVKRPAHRPARGRRGSIRAKSLMLLPERYRIACVDELDLIARAVVVWAKPNGLPESVTDRVRRSHEDWVHLTKVPRYFSAVDEIREEHVREWGGKPNGGGTYRKMKAPGEKDANLADCTPNPLGKLPGSVWEIASQPLRVPAELGVDHFACVDIETEVLTRRGWLRHDEVQVGDEVAGYDLDIGMTSWTRCHGVHRYDYDGELVTAEARGLSMRVTPNHRTLIHDHRGRHRLRGPVEVIDAAQLDKRHAIPRAVEWVENGREKSIGADLAALLGWVSAEGWYGNKRTQVYLSQSASVNAPKVAEIDALLARLGDEPLRTERARETYGKSWVEVQWRLGSALAAEVMRLMPDKLLTVELTDVPLHEARPLLAAFVAGDGHARSDGRLWIGQKIRQNLDVLQALAVRLGYNTTLRRDDLNERWALYLNPPRPARLRRSDGKSLVGRERYTGVVWCVTTGTGTFVARRNGSVFVTGNSFPMEWPRRLIQGWCPREVCTACGEGRRPVGDKDRQPTQRVHNGHGFMSPDHGGRDSLPHRTLVTITGYACACPDVSAPIREVALAAQHGVRHRGACRLVDVGRLTSTVVRAGEEKRGQVGGGHEADSAGEGTSSRLGAGHDEVRSADAPKLAPRHVGVPARVVPAATLPPEQRVPPAPDLGRAYRLVPQRQIEAVVPGAGQVGALLVGPCRDRGFGQLAARQQVVAVPRVAGRTAADQTRAGHADCLSVRPASRSARAAALAASAAMPAAICSSVGRRGSVTPGFRAMYSAHCSSSAARLRPRCSAVPPNRSHHSSSICVDRGGLVGARRLLGTASTVTAAIGHLNPSAGAGLRVTCNRATVHATLFHVTSQVTATRRGATNPLRHQRDPAAQQANALLSATQERPR